MKKTYCSYLSQYKKLMYLTLISLIFVNKLSYAFPDFNYTTSVEYPELDNGTIFEPTFSHSHKLLFYTGKKDGNKVSGYFRSRHFLGWKEYKFPPLEYYSDVKEKAILAVSNGPKKNTIVLSYVEGYGQILSSSENGKTWYIRELKTENNHFSTLVHTDANETEQVFLYGRRHVELLSSLDGDRWQYWAFPNPCISDHHCFIENKYFNNVTNGYVLLQARTHESTETNKMYFTTNVTDWYTYEVPFEHDFITKAFKGKNNELIVGVVSGEDEKTQKLWVTPDYKNWVSFDVPADANISDVKTDNKNKIVMLLSYKKPLNDLELAKHMLCNKPSDECPPCPCEEHHKDDGSDKDNGKETVYKIITDLVTLDPETKLSQTIHSFSGLVKHMHWFDDKLYLSGDFINDSDDKHAALITVS